MEFDYSKFFETAPRKRHSGDPRPGTKKGTFASQIRAAKKITPGHPWWLVAWRVLA